MIPTSRCSTPDQYRLLIGTSPNAPAPKDAKGMGHRPHPFAPDSHPPEHEVRSKGFGTLPIVPARDQEPGQGKGSDLLSPLLL